MDGIEREMRGRATVARVNMHTPAGRILRERYEVRLVPTFLLLDGAGREVWRHQGFPDRGDLLQRIAALAAGA